MIKSSTMQGAKHLLKADLHNNSYDLAALCMVYTSFQAVGTIPVLSLEVASGRNQFEKRLKEDRAKGKEEN